MWIEHIKGTQRCVPIFPPQWKVRTAQRLGFDLSEDLLQELLPKFEDLPENFTIDLIEALPPVPDYCCYYY